MYSTGCVLLQHRASSWNHEFWPVWLQPIGLRAHIWGRQICLCCAACRSHHLPLPWPWLPLRPDLLPPASQQPNSGHAPSRPFIDDALQFSRSSPEGSACIAASTSRTISASGVGATTGEACEEAAFSSAAGRCASASCTMPDSSSGLIECAAPSGFSIQLCRGACHLLALVLPGHIGGAARPPPHNHSEMGRLGRRQKIDSLT